MKKKVIPILLALCITISMIAGCSNSPDKGTGNAPAAQAKKIFVFGDTTFNPENSEPDVNPHNSSSGWACLRYGIGETLFHYSDSMEIGPWLAKSYELVDNLTWKITLQDKVYFTSGRHMDGAAVKECLENLVKVHKRAAGDLNINKITAEGQTITIVTSVPVPALLNYLADPYGCIYDVQAGVTKEGIVAATGPYKAVALVSGQRLNLVKNDKYWNGQPKIDEITVRTITDGDTLTMALQSGEIDAAYGMPYASYPLFKNDKYVFTSSATSRAFFAWMNFKSEITNDAAVRKAIAMGIDKKSFVETLLNGNGYPAVGVFPSSFTFGNEAVHTESYNPESAKKILEDAGWIDTDGDGIREKGGKKLVIRWLTYPSRQELPLLAESAQATLKKIGIGVEINSTADHNSIRVKPDAWDVYASAMVTAPTGDPEYFFTYCSLDKSATNNGKYHNDKLEQLAQEMAQTFDKEKRGKLAIEMQQTILDDNAYVFASHLRMSMIAKVKVTGLVAHPCDFYEITADLDIK
ncbi:MAG TPA: ABC transporter substrate-binding protein [Patescibacteria group bacterium]|nr:ABC transporter substrate-binding protein [Patescibacteria group bacterium]